MYEQKKQIMKKSRLKIHFFPEKMMCRVKFLRENDDKIDNRDAWKRKYKTCD